MKLLHKYCSYTASILLLIGATSAHANSCEQPLMQRMNKLSLQVVEPLHTLKQSRDALKAAPSLRYKHVIAATYSSNIPMEERHRQVDIRLHEQTVMLLDTMVANAKTLQTTYQQALNDVKLLASEPEPQCKIPARYLGMAYQGELETQLKSVSHMLQATQRQRQFHQTELARLNHAGTKTASVSKRY